MSIAKLNLPAYREHACKHNRCATCGSTEGLQFHHEPPKGQGGDDLLGAVLCSECHFERHHVIGSGEKFWAKYGLDPLAIALQTLRQYLLQWSQEPAKVKVPKRKQPAKTEAETAGRWSKPVPNSKPRGKQRKYERITK